MILKLATAQYPIKFHQNFESWQSYTESWVKSAYSQGANILLFPEYGSMELVSLLEENVRNDIKKQVLEINKFRERFCDFFSRLAQLYQLIIVAPSFPVLENDKVYNRAYVFSEKGFVGYQDKFFMTRFENEEWGISSAPKVLHIFQGNWGSFGIQICYDVEFPIGSQLMCSHGVTLILAPSCTETIRGATRVHVGSRARALENQCFVAVSQTINQAEWSPAVDINFGYTAIYCPADKNLPEEGIVAIQPPQQEGWLIQSLDFELISAVRTDGQVFNFKDLQGIKSNLAEEIKIIYHQL
jgi:predicted amidohydrolase